MLVWIEPGLLGLNEQKKEQMQVGTHLQKKTLKNLKDLLLIVISPY